MEKCWLGLKGDIQRAPDFLACLVNHLTNQAKADRGKKKWKYSLESWRGWAGRSNLNVKNGYLFGCAFLKVSKCAQESPASCRILKQGIGIRESIFQPLFLQRLDKGTRWVGRGRNISGSFQAHCEIGFFPLSHQKRRNEWGRGDQSRCLQLITLHLSGRAVGVEGDVHQPVYWLPP